MATRVRDVEWWKRPSQAVVNGLSALAGGGSSPSPTYVRGEVPNQTRTMRGSGSSAGESTLAQRNQRRDERARMRAPTAEEEAATIGAPGSGGFDDPRFGPGGVTGDRNQQVAPYEDPYAEFLQGYLSDLTSSYDSQINAIGGLDPIFRQQAGEAQDNIGGFFNYAKDVANAGKPATQETFDTATGNVDSVYDNLGSQLQGMPQQLTDIASQAAGEDVGGSVAGRVASATAPFMAAGETSRANATANLTQNNAAGQNYLTQLASATGAEAGMHQSAVEGAMQQQLQLVAYRQAELEGAKQRALMEVSSDIAGESSERMAQAALSSALGLDLPGGVDPMDYLRGQQMMQGEAVDPIQQERDLIGLEQARQNLAQDRNPNFNSDLIKQSLSVPASKAFDNIQRNVEANFNPQIDDPKDMTMMLLKELDAYALGGGLDTNFANSRLGGNANDIEAELREAIRRL